MKVVFKLDEEVISVDARVPVGNLPEDGRRVMTINNAIEDIKEKYSVNMRSKFEDVYSAAEIVLV